MLSRKNLAIIYSLVSVLLFSSCSREVRFSTLDTVRTIDSFPREYHLADAETLDIDLMGVVDMKTFGPLTVYLTPQDSTLWKLAFTSDHQIAGRALQKGAGPGEFINLPSIIDVTHTEDTTILLVKDSHAKKFYNVIVDRKSESFDDVSIHEINNPQYDGYTKDVRWMIPMSDSLIYICKYDLSGKGFKRMRLSGDELQDIQNLGTLQGNFRDLKDLNTLAFIPIANPRGTDIAELMIRLNQINLYSLSDTTKRMTICVGNRVDDINETDSRHRMNRINQYKSGESFPDFFVALYSGELERDIDSEKSSSQLQFFDWDGNPLLRIKLDVPINSFHIDKSGNIYGFSPYGAAETIYKWDASDILKDKNL